MFINISLFAKGPEYKLLISEYMPKEYGPKIIKKTTILLTEARLYLQKKYKKKISFIYTPEHLTDKKEIKKSSKN